MGGTHVRHLRPCFALLLALNLVPMTVGAAVQMKWASGSSNLNFTSARRCTLMVHTGTSDPPLPSEWELQWVVKNSARPPIAVREETSAGQDTALLCSLTLPIDAASPGTNFLIADFCSGGSLTASWARYIFDMPANTKGNFQAIAFHPTNSD